MKTILKFFTLLLTLSILTISCSEDTPDLNTETEGCTDVTAVNYNADATVDNGSCTYAIIEGCTDPLADNYNPSATVDDGSCTYPPIEGCTDPQAENYNMDAVVDDGSCIFAADKFFGSYEGSSDCMGGVIIGTLSNTMLAFEIGSALDPNDPNIVVFTFPIQGIPVAMTAVVEGDVMNVNSLLSDLPVPNPLDPMSTINVNILMVGPMNYNKADDTISGDLELTITLSATGTTLDQGICAFTGVKL